jgi:multidrug efflux pump subunit AcrB
VVEATYPGANAPVVADTVAAPIEEQVYGVEKMVSLSSRSANDGTYTLTVTFQPGVDLKRALVLVQNRVNLALPILPDVVKVGGIKVRQGSPGVLQLVTLSSPGGRFDTLYMGNYAVVQIREELVRLAGVNDILLLGQRDYAFRVWLDPARLAARKLNVGDVIKALRDQNLKVPKEPEGKKEAEAPLTVETLGRLVGPEQLAEVILKQDGGLVIRLKEVGHIELGASGPESYVDLNGKPAVALAVYPTWQARPREVSAAVQKRVAELRARLPEGLHLETTCDFTANLTEPNGPTPPRYLLLDPAVPGGASLERARRAFEHCASEVRKDKAVKDVLILSDNPFDRVPNRACILVRRAAAGADPLPALRARLKKLPDLTVRVRDLSGPGRFPRCGYPVDLAVHGPELPEVRDLSRKLAEKLRGGKQLTDVWVEPSPFGRPQLYLDIDRTGIKDRNVPLNNVLTTLEAYLGPLHVNDFNRFGRTWQVVVQTAARPGKQDVNDSNTFGRTWKVPGPADPDPRKQVEDIKRLQVRNARGEMVPLGGLVTARTVEGPEVLTCFNKDFLVEVTANPAPGVSLAEIRKLCESQMEAARRELRLPASFRLTWLQDMPRSK